ncbi:MAG: hypothetical protein LH475_03575 [Cryobacterium sp.]|uniref:hypothetical protein n=1 Tax=unclassified Cryobacterium TaxID=2649013 RepID=UPI0018C9B01B|nr:MULTISPECIES: hypothetical protein [unclassified Cryobacterium]MCY7403701.1 hypothetical protein [Cryobacterium sp.]MEC5154712.1 hypothetical protein [Cryobacterium sp. CAN_C3]
MLGPLDAQAEVGGEQRRQQTQLGVVDRGTAQSIEPMDGRDLAPAQGDVFELGPAGIERDDAAVVQFESRHGGAAEVELFDDAVADENAGQRGVAQVHESRFEPLMCIERSVAGA